MDYTKLSNKKFAYEMLDLLIIENKLTEEEINLLTNAELCRSHFGCIKFPILSEVHVNSILEEGDCYDDSGRQRFYKDKFIIKDRAFIITNHWYGPNKSMNDNRTPFQNWVLEKCK